MIIPKREFKDTDTIAQTFKPDDLHFYVRIGDKMKFVHASRWIYPEDTSIPEI